MVSGNSAVWLRMFPGHLRSSIWVYICWREGEKTLDLSNNYPEYDNAVRRILGPDISRLQIHCTKCKVTLALIKSSWTIFIFTSYNLAYLCRIVPSFSLSSCAQLSTCSCSKPASKELDFHYWTRKPNFSFLLPPCFLQSRLFFLSHLHLHLYNSSEKWQPPRGRRCELQ